MGLVDSWEASRPVVGGKLSKVRVLWFSKSGLKWDKTGEYRRIGLPLAPGTSLEATQGGGQPGERVKGRRAGYPSYAVKVTRTRGIF
jgi:hypothetical protein